MASLAESLNMCTPLYKNEQKWEGKTSMETTNSVRLQLVFQLRVRFTNSVSKFGYKIILEDKTLIEELTEF